MLSHAPLSITIRVAVLLVRALLFGLGLKVLTHTYCGPLIMLTLLLLLSCVPGLTPEKSAPENPGVLPPQGLDLVCFQGHDFQCKLRHCISYFGNTAPAS